MFILCFSGSVFQGVYFPAFVTLLYFYTYEIFILLQQKISKTGGVDKMTDQAHYTGAHKERFGADGKGKGIDGRVDRHENKGYVGQYKGEGTYDKKH